MTKRFAKLILVLGVISMGLSILWLQVRRTWQVDSAELPKQNSAFERYLDATANDYFERTRALVLCQAIQDNDQVVVMQQMKSDIINESGVGGMTPLMWALACGRLDMFETLLQHGANPNTSLQETVTIRRIVLEKGNTPLLLSLKNRQFDFFHKALKYVKDASQADSEGWTLLHYHIASIGGDGSAPADKYVVEVIDQLLVLGADVNAQARSGDTPLHIAVGKQPAYCIPLFERGADPTLKNDEGDSALDLLLRDTSPGLAPHIKLATDWLREKGYYSSQSGTDPAPLESVQ
ncbi:MAG: hypothetical protein IT422_10350 [Pirellulaceae bacterium]|nr:hypothetical protein [Pirellulaceae bacterium]